MSCITKFVGLDVSKVTIAVAIADEDCSLPHYLGAIVHSPEAARKTVMRLGKPDELLICYEAGPTGFGL